MTLRLEGFKGACRESRTGRGIGPFESRCPPRAQTVHVSTLFRLFGLTLNEKQIPQTVEKNKNQDAR